MAPCARVAVRACRNLSVDARYGKNLVLSTGMLARGITFLENSRVRATSWTELQIVHERFFADDNQQAHVDPKQPAAPPEPTTTLAHRRQPLYGGIYEETSRCVEGGHGANGCKWQPIYD